MIIIDIPSVLEVLLVVLEIEKETLLLIIVYHMPDPLGTFIDGFIIDQWDAKTTQDFNYWWF